MLGLGFLQSLWVTLSHFVNTYVDDIQKGKGRYNSEKGVCYRSGADVKGIFTVQYPEEKLILPEAFRFVPFLIYEELPDGERKMRCTACGICAKVCPPQCIWIARKNDPKTGRPAPSPAEFYIDIDICMNCGMCAEYCPFDSIKMDHDYEISSYTRLTNNIYNLEKLAKPLSYYARIHPGDYAEEMALKAEKEAKK